MSFVSKTDFFFFGAAILAGAIFFLNRGPVPEPMPRSGSVAEFIHESKEKGFLACNVLVGDWIELASRKSGMPLPAQGERFWVCSAEDSPAKGSRSVSVALSDKNGNVLKKGGFIESD